MRAVGIVAEYNPFHKGHAYHLQKAKEMTEADLVVVIMSGSFVQRGAPAVMDKWLRTRLALLAGADLVLELPLPYATSSADYFARGAVESLAACGFVTHLAFGAETPDLSLLSEVASLSACVTRNDLLPYLRKGATYPQAVTAHLLDLLNKMPENVLQGAKKKQELLFAPNNMLGIAYLRALRELSEDSPASPGLIPAVIPRVGASYHDMTLQAGTIPSASALRNALRNGIPFSDLIPYLPENHISLWQEQYGKTFPLFADDLSDLLFERLMEESASSLSSYLGISEDLANRIDRLKSSYSSFSDFAALVKSKQYTRTGVERALIHVLLQIRQLPRQVPYLRVLGAKEPAVLSLLSKQASLPVITGGQIPLSLQKEEAALSLFELEFQAAERIRYLIRRKFKGDLPSEYRQPLILLEK